MENSKSNTRYKLGDLVFAKMKGFPYWPGIIANPPNELKKTPLKSGNHCIFFFGSKNYSWVEADKLKLYSENKELSNASKLGSFKKAIEEIEIFIEKGLNLSFLTKEDPFDYLLSSDSTTPKSKKKSLNAEEPSSSSSAKKKDDSTPSAKRSDTSNKSAAKRKSEVQGPDKDDKRPRVSSGSRTSGRLSQIHIKKVSLSTPKKSSPLKKEAKSPEISPVTKSSSLVQNDTLSDDFSFLSNSSFVRPLRVESPPLNIEKITETLAKKNIQPSSLKFGFIGLGMMGSGLVKNLLNSKHKVTVWNRSQEKCQDFVKAGAQEAITPGDVIVDSDITFCCVSDDTAAKKIVFGNCGVLPEIEAGKSYVEMSGVDISVSQEIGSAVTAAGGRYLEVRFQGSKPEAEEGTLMLLAAGDRSLYDDCASAFAAFSQKQMFLGEVGKAACMQIILHSVFASLFSLLMEVLPMAQLYNASIEDLLNVCQRDSFISPYMVEKIQSAVRGDISPKMSVKYLQKDVDMALGLSNRLDVLTPIMAVTNEYLKYCKNSGYKEADIGALMFMKK